MSTGKGLSTAIERLARKCKVDPELLEDAYPCTGLQAALVAASLNGLGDYVSRFVFDLANTGLEAQAVRAGCEELYEQTAILRSRVVENNGQFLQVVVRGPVEWHEHDDLQQYLALDKQNSVALGEPLVKFAWIEQQDGKIYMVWSLHHCQYDDWSFKLLVQDLTTAASRSPSSGSIHPRPPYSKFIKALNHTDQTASESFWATKLQHISASRSISSSRSVDASRTTSRLEKSYTVQFPPSSLHQPSVLAVAAWSLLIRHYSGSSNVLFGHVLSGRTSDLQGIQDICGPTLATVPWSVDVKADVTLEEFLQTLEKLRLEVLPFEQTGLAEYRKLRGTAAFDTLLSVRASQDENGTANGSHYVQPQKPDATDLNHPCSIFLEVDIDGDDCKLKASYDEHLIDPRSLEGALDKFALALGMLLSNSDTTIGDFSNSLHFSPSLGVANSAGPTSEAPESEHQEDRGNLDAALIAKVEKLAIRTSGVQDATAVNANTTLMQLGMDSLKTVVFSRNLSKAFKVDIPFKDITGPRRTLSEVAASVAKATHGHDDESPEDISLLVMADTHMESLRSVNIASGAGEQISNSTKPAILLTGATGYLGIEILRQCLSSSQDEVVLLVRCQSPEDGMKRVRNTATMASWTSSEIDTLQRVRIWPSDISQDQLGLSPENWQILSNPQSASLRFTAFIHNGAKVDFLHTYADMEAANVRSTATLLEQHLRAAHKPNFVFVTGGRPCPLTPDDPHTTAGRLAAAPGYAQTKFVSELLVHETKALYEASGQSVQMSIVHPGSIIGSAETGVANTDDFIWRYVAASLSMGLYVPAVPTMREWINLTPVDAVATEIVSLAAEKDDSQSPSHEVVRCLMRSGLPIRQFWDVVVGVLQANGTAVQPVSEWEWLAEFEDDLNQKGQDQPLFSLSQLLLQGSLTGIGGQPPIIDSKTGILPDTTAAVAALRSNVQYLSKKGFFSLDGQSGQDGSGLFVRSKA